MKSRLDSNESIGPYRPIQVLGRGGMGVVYRAEHVETGQIVALKTVLVPERSYVSSIRREIHALAAIRHPGVVRIVDEGLQSGVPWYAMELLEGTELRSLCATKPTSLTPVLSLVRRLCAPLAYLHGEGIVHRDLKPDNVLVRPDGMPVIVDFGLVARVGGPLGSEVLDLSGVPTGTAAYMAPEQIGGNLIDARADLYALGCIFYELLTGRPPFVSSVPYQIYYQHCFVAAPPPSSVAPEIPRELDQLVLRMLSKRPEDRFGYADDIAAVLAGLGAENGAALAAMPRPKAYLYRPGLAGRDKILERVEHLLVNLEDGAGGLVLLGGESGAGKTRLTTEIARRTTGRGISLLAGECVPQTAASDSRPGTAQADTAGASGGQPVCAPLQPLRRTLQSVADRCREGGAAETARLLGRRGPVLRLFEPALADLPGQEAQAAPAELGAEAARLRLFSDLTETLAALTLTPAAGAPASGPFGAGASARTAFLLILDDLHWADDLTLGWLEFLVRGGHLQRLPLLIIGTYRSEEVGLPGRSPPEPGASRRLRLEAQTNEGSPTPDGAAPAKPSDSGLERLLAAPTVTRIDLGLLDESAVGAMLADMLALEKPPPLFARFLASTSEGNPFFVAEYLHAAVAESLLYRDQQGRWHVAEEGGAAGKGQPYEGLPLPTSLRMLALRRLESLSGPARALVDSAAVIGRSAATPLVWRGLELGVTELFEATAEALRRQFLEEIQGSGSAPTLRFVHDKLREVAYESMSSERRRDRHRAAAEGIEALYPEKLQEMQAELARHWEGAGELARARNAYLAAARLAQSRYAQDEAERLYRAYLRLVDQPTSESLRARRELGFDVLQVRGRFQEALDVQEAGLAEARQIGDRAAEAGLLNGLAAARWSLGQSAEAFDLCQKALTLAREIGAPELESRSLSHLAILRMQTERRAEARPLYEQSLELSRQRGDKHSESATLGNLAILNCYEGRRSEAQEQYEQVLSIARELGDRRSEGLTLGNLAHLQADQGHVAAAMETFEKALRLLREAGFRAPEAAFLAAMAELEDEAGRPESARLRYDQALAVARDIGDARRVEAWSAAKAKVGSKGVGSRQ